MSVFSDEKTAAEIFGELFTILGEDAEFVSKLRESELSIRLLHTKPDCTVYVSADEVVVGPQAPETATITIKMSCDTAHALWLGELAMPAAVATGKVRIRGKVAKVLELVPILRPAFDQYPKIAAQHGIES